MPSKPKERLPTWATDPGADVLDPGTAGQATGLVPGERVSAGHLNWVLRENGKRDAWIEPLPYSNIIFNRGNRVTEGTAGDTGSAGNGLFPWGENERLFGMHGDNFGRTFLGLKNSHFASVLGEFISYQYSRDDFCQVTISNDMWGHGTLYSLGGSSLIDACANGLPGDPSGIEPELYFIGAGSPGITTIDDPDFPNSSLVQNAGVDQVAPAGVGFVDYTRMAATRTGMMATHMSGVAAAVVGDENFNRNNFHEKPRAYASNALMVLVSDAASNDIRVFLLNCDINSWPTADSDYINNPWFDNGSIAGAASNGCFGWDIGYNEASPATSTVIVKPFADTPLRSTNGGASFTPIAPSAVDADTSTVRWMGGTTWVAFSRPFISKITQDIIYISNDDGITWTAGPVMSPGWTVTEMQSDLCGTWMASMHRVNSTTTSGAIMRGWNHGTYPTNFEGCETLAIFSCDQGCRWVKAARMGIGSKLEGYWGGAFRWTGASQSRLLDDGEPSIIHSPSIGTQHMLSTGSSLRGTDYKEPVIIYECP